MPLILVLIILGIGASNAKTMSERQAAVANQTAHEQTAIRQAEPSIRLAYPTKSFGKKKYTWISGSRSWNNQRSVCNSGNYGDLASILSYAEFEKITQEFHAQLHNQCTWVGAKLHLQGTNDITNNWYWLTGEPLSPMHKKWQNNGAGTKYPASGSKSRDCVYIDESGNMREGNGPSLYPHPCTSGCYALCEMSAPPSEN